MGFLHALIVTQICCQVIFVIIYFASFNSFPYNLIIMLQLLSIYNLNEIFPRPKTSGLFHLKFKNSTIFHFHF